MKNLGAIPQARVATISTVELRKAHGRVIDRIQILVLSWPGKLTGGIFFVSLFAIVIDPFVSAIVLVIFSSVLGLMTATYWWQKNQAVKERDKLAADHAALVERVAQIELQSHVLAQAMLPVSAAFQAILVKELTHMHMPETDELLKKLGPPFILTQTEEERLAWLLERRTMDMDAEITPSERDAARMMPALMRRVRAEAEAEAAAAAAAAAFRMAPKLVSMTVVVEAPTGDRKALLIPTQADTVQSEQDILASAIAENTRLTREANEAAHEILKLKKGE